MLEQKKAEDFGITEDDVSEIRQDINKFRFELLDILRKNKFDIGKIRSVGGCYGGRRAKQMERRIMKGFTLEIYDLLKDSLDKQDKNKSVDIFQVMAEAMQKTSKSNQPKEFDASADYSPATVVAAGKFKRFLGKHLKQSESSNNNIHHQQGSSTAPCSPQHSKHNSKLGRIEVSSSLEAGDNTVTDSDNMISSRQRDNEVVNDIHSTLLENRNGNSDNSSSLSCSKLTRVKKSNNVTGGWI